MLPCPPQHELRDRKVPLIPKLLEALRKYWRASRIMFADHCGGVRRSITLVSFL